jgi:hypothetical protein
MPGSNFGPSLCRIAGLAALLALASQPLRSQEKHARQAKQPAAPPAYSLYPADTIDFSAPPPMMVTSGIKCDARGNIYVVYSGSPQSVLSQSNGVAVLGISKISPGDKSVTAYPLPSISDYSNLLRFGFDVDSTGAVYALVAAERQPGSGDKPKPAWLVVKYNDDGTINSYSEIGDEPGKRIQPLRLAVFGDGDFLLSGTTAGKDELGTFAGVFDRQGAFVAPLKLGEAVAHAKKPQAPGAGAASGQSAPPESAKAAQQKNAVKQQAAKRDETRENPVSLESSTLSFSSPDGNIYVLQGTSSATLYAVSPSGEIVRKFFLKPPARGFAPVQMSGAGPGYLFVEYGHTGRSSAGPSPLPAGYIAVLDSETGHVAATYRLPSGAAGFPACAVSSDDFLFLGTSKDNHLEVVRYVAR